EYHLLNVLHKKIGDKLNCCFEQKKYLTTIVCLNPLLAKIENEIVEDTIIIPNIHLFQAIIKSNHFDWIVQKATELQVNNLFPVLMNRSQSNREINPKHIKNIIKNAGMQSNQTNLMELCPVIKSLEMFDLLKNYDHIIVPYEKENRKSLTKFLNDLDYHNNNKIAIVVGPEGGYSENEITLFSQLGKKCHFVSLTKSILRSETASLYAISVVMDNLQLKINNDGDDSE
ncbi:MAG: RNA methyltransferase, partial [Ureaplasma sp.]|nr:RNA methyltransferase [Ureaplasma sp.]